LIFSDQQRWDALGVHQPWLHTPHLDRLAAEGLLVERSYAPTPVCLPSRASTLTGQYSTTHGAMHNYSYLPQDWEPMLSRDLSAAGYATHLIGKTHFSGMFDAGSLESFPRSADRGFFRDWHGPWYGFERAELSIGHSTQGEAPHMHYGVWLEERGVDIDSYFGNTPYEAAGVWDLPEEHHSSAWVAERTMSALDDRARDGRPFFIWTNFPDPHNPYYAPEPWASMYVGAEVPLPQPRLCDEERSGLERKPAFYRDLQDSPSPWRWRPRDPDLPLLAGNVTALDLDENALRRTIATYYAMTSMLDRYVGRILDHLDRLGLTDDTVVVFTSDHGDLLGDHGLWWKGLVSYEESMRLPFIVRAPGRVPAGRRSSALQSLVDLAPTFYDLASIPCPTGVEGRSQRQLWEGGSALRDELIVEERPSFTPWEQRVLVTASHKLVTYAGRDEGELYDLEADPHQWVNLWADPAFRRLRESLLDRLSRHPRGRAEPPRSPTLDPGMAMLAGAR
jgi:uncharacterized sulfatase